MFKFYLVVKTTKWLGTKFLEVTEHNYRKVLLKQNYAFSFKWKQVRLAWYAQVLPSAFPDASYFFLTKILYAPTSF